MTPAITPSSVFNEIALCLSGGGYRAAAFHLGTLDMLDELGLLSSVNRFSTVSGGTIIGMTYAVSVVGKNSFGSFYKNFYSTLKDINVIQDALDNLYTNVSPSGTNDLSLIRSAAQVYSKNLFQQKQFNLLLSNVGTPFKELIFNATEFRIGNSFRFRASSDANARIGNNNFRVEKPVAEQIHLSDIVASSSCFPGAFEPIRFPDDFYWNDTLDEIRAKLKSGFVDDKGNPVSVPLMDGGIYDNQGLSSMLLADDIKHPEIDLFIISDTNQRDDDVLNFPVKERKGYISLNTLWWMGLALLILSLISAIAVTVQFIRKWGETNFSLFDFIFRHPYESFFVYLIPIFLAVAVVIIFAWVYRIGSLKQKVEIAGEEFELWQYVRRLTLPDLLNLLESRMSSLLALTGQVFMKRIRQLILTSVMATPERRNRVAFNILYDMLLSHPRIKAKDPDLEPSDGLKAVADRAEKMETTLWFANESDLKNLIVCGQATVCFSILRFLLDHHDAAIKDPKSPFHALFVLAKDRWMKMKQNPDCFLERPRP